VYICITFTIDITKIVQYVLYCTSYIIYNLYFHPLRHFPGPKLSAATCLYPSWYLATGRRHHYNAWVHDKYGEIVRTAPDQLSFINDQAWRDIYMHRQGHGQLQKSVPRLKINGAYHIINAPDDVHARQRKMLSHAFSERALREQEPLIKKYVDLLISHMHEDAAAGKPVDIVSYFNFLTFDIVADLSFASPLGALQDRKEHPWMATFFRGVKLDVIVMQFLLISGVMYIMVVVAWVLRLFDVQMKSFQFTKDKVSERLEKGSERPDFMGVLLRNNEKAEEGEGISRAEIDATFSILMAAGSETTATLLSGCMYLLQRNPEVREKLQVEVRGAFANEDEITVTKVNSLPYLLAVLEESLRYYPPVPIALGRRTPPEGVSICGRWVPGGMAVGIPQLAANHSPVNFVNPDKFVPERFLPDRDSMYEKDRKAVMQPFSAGPRNCLGRK
jgi:cytochrome P450